MKNTLIKKLLSVLLIALFVLSIVFSVGCSLEKKPDDGAHETEPLVTETAEPVKIKGNPVVLSSKHIDYTLYDFRNAYYSNQYYMYMLYGMISAEDYFNMVIEDASSVVYIYNAAIDAGVTLSEADELQFEQDFNNQIEAIISQYQNDVDPAVTDEAARREEAIKLLNEDLENDGLDYDTFLELMRKNMLMFKITDNYYAVLKESIEVTESDVNDYINEKLSAIDDVTMTSFKNEFEAYSMGEGAFPVYIPDECFSVDHILLLFETSADGNGGITYDTESRRDTEAELERKLVNCEDYDAFMELEVEYGEDPGMDEEGYRENGYIIHGDFDSVYYSGFVYAAMNLYYGSWEPAADADYTKPELTFFELKDGTKVVKAATEPGIHYIIVNKTFSKGQSEYEVGDAHWHSWSEAIKDKKLSDQYDALFEGWKEAFPITDNSDEIKPEFVPEEVSDDDKK